MDYSAVLVLGKRPNHVLHLLLTLVTAGMWLVVWLFLTLTSGEGRRTLIVDEFGTVTLR